MIKAERNKLLLVRDKLEELSAAQKENIDGLNAEMLTQKKNYAELKEEKEDLELRKETLEKVIEGFELDKVQNNRLIDSQKN